MYLLLAAALLVGAHSPPPSPSPSPAPRIRASFDAFTNFIDSASSGPGITPPEGFAFANGSPVSPNTPYDLFSSAPVTPGVADISQLNATLDYSGSRYDANAVIGAAYVTGSMQNVLYWGENVLPAINPHLGSSAIPYAIAFPSHAGQDDATASKIAPLSASFGAHGGSWVLRGGYFDLNQSDKFIFVQPQLTNVIPNTGLQTAESLGDGPAAIDAWPSPPPGLPLDGLDLTAHRGVATLELSDAALPALPGTSARITLGSLVLDHGRAARYSVSLLHLTTGGAPIPTTTLYGVLPLITPGYEGMLPTSTLGGQVETIAGARAAFHIAPSLDAVAEVGRSWYNASDVQLPATNRPGGFYHAGLTHTHGRTSISADYYRFEARYADAILPYGMPENIWSAPWAWPGVWLKSNYQLVDNTQAPGANRQGYRLKYAVNGGPLEFRAAYSAFHQIEPATIENMQQVGFVEGFFLPQSNGEGTLGQEHQYNAWLAWHPAFGDLTLDYANDLLHRSAFPSQPQDYVTYQAPQVVFTYARSIGKTALVDAGFGRYAMRGSWAQTFTNVDYFQNTGFIAAQFAENTQLAFLVQLRRSHFAGLPTALGGPSPNFDATQLVIEQRAKF